MGRPVVAIASDTVSPTAPFCVPGLVSDRMELPAEVLATLPPCPSLAETEAE